MRRYLRHVDELGRIVIPVEFRNELGIGAGSPLDICTEGDAIVLGHHRQTCAFCREPTEHQFRGKPVCGQCADDLRRLALSLEGYPSSAD